ncbi:hypothetical protein E3N88_18262 [Mikania micrantha]|uniref:Uncharacterized protein n=1 Tax=Mikania micrantha TaxID=192012 RepID=A0A5N6NUE1_9ASTR|nr:hypothetical protein E3N88_18262 [Mikania micrantha]
MTNDHEKEKEFTCIKVDSITTMVEFLDCLEDLVLVVKHKEVFEESKMVWSNQCKKGLKLNRGSLGINEKAMIKLHQNCVKDGADAIKKGKGKVVSVPKINRAAGINYRDKYAEFIAGPSNYLEEKAADAIEERAGAVQDEL